MVERNCGLIKIIFQDVDIRRGKRIQELRVSFN